MEEFSKSINDEFIIALSLAVKEAIKKAKETNTLLVVVKDGQVVEVRPDSLEV